MLTKWTIMREISTIRLTSVFWLLTGRTSWEHRKRKFMILGGIFNLQSWFHASKLHLSGCTASPNYLLYPFFTVYRALNVISLVPLICVVDRDGDIQNEPCISIVHMFLDELQVPIISGVINKIRDFIKRLQFRWRGSDKMICCIREPRLVKNVSTLLISNLDRTTIS